MGCNRESEKCQPGWMKSPGVERDGTGTILCAFSSIRLIAARLSGLPMTPRRTYAAVLRSFGWFASPPPGRNSAATNGEDAMLSSHATSVELLILTNGLFGSGGGP